MKSLIAFLRLIRWPNLLFIVLTQLLFYSCVYLPLFANPQPNRLAWLIAASVFIAAAGYIINDYFDLNIDQINKPEKNVFVRLIHRRWAFIWHFLLSLAGIVCTAFGVGLHKWYLVLANIFCVALLWFYSTSFKRQFLIGNIVIGLLTAWTVLILFFAFTAPGNAFHANSFATIKFFRIAFLYAGFAFTSTLIREAIKDMEDLEGDARLGCRTLPIVAGVRTTRIYVAVWIVVLTAALLILQLYILQFRWWFAVFYCILLVVVPLVYLLVKLFKANKRADFTILSKLSKAVMLTGIVSMIFFYIYF